MITTALSIVLTIITLVLTLSLGLLLRRILVHRLANTVLDNWIVQTMGAIVLLLPFFFAAFAISLEWRPLLIYFYLELLKQQFGLANVSFRPLVFNFIGTLLLIGLGVGIARTVQRLIVRGLGENRIDINIRTLVGRVFYVVILLFVALWILSLWSVSLTFPVAAISILTVAITVSIQDVLKDLVAGVYILIERPFHIGDQVSTTNVLTYVGVVQDIQLRATKLRLVTGEEVTIPNSMIFGSIVINNTFYGERRATLTATLPMEAYTQHETAQEILGAIKSTENVTPKPEPTLFVSSCTSTTITLTIRFWINLGASSTVSDVMYTLHKTLPQAELVVKESAGDV